MAHAALRYLEEKTVIQIKQTFLKLAMRLVQDRKSSSISTLIEVVRIDRYYGILVSFADFDVKHSKNIRHDESTPTRKNNLFFKPLCAAATST
jgi:hypothetical protein